MLFLTSLSPTEPRLQELLVPQHHGRARLVTQHHGVLAELKLREVLRIRASTVELQHLLCSDASTEGLVDIPLLAFTELVHEADDAALPCCLALPFDHIGNFL